jgi:kynurenine formamidase
MKIYDVSSPLYEGMPVYPGDPEFKCEEIPAGDAVISKLSLSTHTGTHIDAPSHYFAGASGIDDISLERLICRVEVTEFPNFSGNVPAVFF